MEKYSMKYEIPLPQEPMNMSSLLEKRSARFPAIGAIIRYPTVRIEKITPIAVPEALISMLATNGIRKSRKKKPKLFQIVRFTIA
jgi:hypothetical protein